jgi:hypothetical protein
LLFDFEREALKETGRYKTIPEKKEADRKSAEHYWNVVSKKIRDFDEEMVDKTDEIARDFHLCSIFNPVTFYKSVNNELGSKGYNSYYRFFKENLPIQRRFLRHVFNKRYYDNYTKVEPFLPLDQLVVRAEPGLPRYFGAGILLGLFYLATAIYLGYFVFKGFMFPKPVFHNAYDQVKLDCQQGSIQFVTSDNIDLYERLVNVFCNYPLGFNGSIMVDNQDMVNNRQEGVVYIPGAESIPGNFRVRDLVYFTAKMPGIPIPAVQELEKEYRAILKKYFHELSPGDRTCLLVDLCRLKEAKIYLIREFKPVNYGKSLVKALNKIKDLKKGSALILCLAEIFMTPDKAYYYCYDIKERRYIDLEHDDGYEG